MKRLIYIFIIILFSSCASVKPKQKILQELKKEEFNKINLKYSIEIPKNWFPYLEYHRLVAYAPRKFKKNIENNNIDLFFTIYYDTASSNNIDEVTENFVKKMNKSFNNFIYKIIEAKHKEYDKYKIVKYKTEIGGKVKTVISALILDKDLTYRFFYSTSNELFEKYLVDVFEMINSFKTKE